jgi:hypothetical protein
MALAHIPIMIVVLFVLYQVSRPIAGLALLVMGSPSQHWACVVTLGILSSIGLAFRWVSPFCVGVLPRNWGFHVVVGTRWWWVSSYCHGLSYPSAGVFCIIAGIPVKGGLVLLLLSGSTPISLGPSS